MLPNQVLLKARNKSLDYENVRHKKTRTIASSGFLIRSLTMTYSHMGTPTLPSAMNRFTSEFGMGSGGSDSLLSPGKLV